MRKSRHQIFASQLHKQWIAEVVSPTDFSGNQYSGSSGDESKEDCMKELERKFDALFGDLDDN